MRAGKLQQLTRDHTMAEELLSHRPAQGAKPLADIRYLALSHVLTRAVGVGQAPVVRPGVRPAAPAAPVQEAAEPAYNKDVVSGAFAKPAGH